VASARACSLLLLLLCVSTKRKQHAQSKTKHTTTRHAQEIQQRQAQYYDNNALSISIPRFHDDSVNIEGETIEKRPEADEVWRGLHREGNYVGGFKPCDIN
jgi:hypothetical protein